MGQLGCGQHARLTANEAHDAGYLRVMCGPLITDSCGFFNLGRETGSEGGVWWVADDGRFVVGGW